MKGKKIESEMHSKASEDLEKSVEKDMEAKDPEGKSLAEFIDNDDGEDEDRLDPFVAGWNYERIVK